MEITVQMAFARPTHRSLRLLFIVGASLILAPTGEAWANDELPELPGEPEPSQAPASRPESPPPYMVEEPFTPPELDGHPGAPHYASPQPYPVHPGYLYEPPPPPPPPPAQRRGPHSSLWLGARLGMIAPFGKLGYDHPDGHAGPNWTDLAGPGSSFELDVGGRFARRYVLYAFWERGSLGFGRDHESFAKEQTRSRTDLFGAGLRWISDPDETGLVLDLGLGFRKFRGDWGEDVSVRAISPIEIRIGIGADIRLGRAFTLSPMMQFSNGAFTSVRLHEPGRSSRSLLRYEAPHGTFGLTIGGHFDLLPGSD